MGIGAMMIPAVSGRSPLSILGADNVPFWVNADNRVDGTPPDVETQTNLANPSNANPTQAVAEDRPHTVAGSSGKTLLDYAASQFLIATGFTADSIWPALTTDLSWWFTGAFDVISGFRTAFEISTSVSNQGLNFRCSATDVIGVRLFAGGGATNATFAHSDTGEALFSGNYNGAFITLFLNGAQVAQVPKTGTLTFAPTIISLGQTVTGIGQWDGKQREIVISPTTPVAGIREELDAYMMGNL